MLHTDEAKRLDDLRLYKILDTAAEKTFDELTQIASAICETPISLISLVDENRQWFKSRHGLDATETPRAYAFCAHSIQGEEMMVVEDATNDERFAENPLVTGAPNIRFYAGVPLIVESGSALGTLCVIDKEPRELTKMQRNALEVLGHAVVTQLELRRSRDDLEAIRQFLPMCAWCRKVRVEGEHEECWQSLHEFIQDVNPVTHGICPDCKSSELSNHAQQGAARRAASL